MTDLLPGPVNRCEAAGGEVKVKYPFVGMGAGLTGRGGGFLRLSTIKKCPHML